MAHKFKIGQAVDLTQTRFRASAVGSYQIVSLVPAPDNDQADPCYRLKSMAEKHDRIASESELTLTEAA